MPEPVHPFSTNDGGVFILLVTFVFILSCWEMGWMACDWDIKDLSNYARDTFISSFNGQHSALSKSVSIDRQ